MVGAKRTRTPLAAGVMACALLASYCVSSQEMPGKGMTCWDKRELCDLNCVYATATELPEGSPSLSECSSGCMTAQASCKDSDETLAYVSCAKECTYTYDASLTMCNQQVSDKTKGTYGANLDACANTASGIMDDCMEECYGEDRFAGWTPMKEEGKDKEGRDLPGLEKDVWRRPFRYDSVVYGRARGEMDAPK